MVQHNKLMTPRKAITMLEYHNAWRRSDSEVPTPMVNPTELGEAIDIVLKIAMDTLKMY